MKTKQIFSLVLTVLVLTSSMVVAQTKAGSDKVVFDVNMHCEACQKKIEKNIAFEKGVKAMEVSLDNKTVALTYDASKTSPEKLQAALVKLGYKATVKGDKAVAKAGCKDTGCKSNALTENKEGCCKDKAAKTDCKDSGCKDKASSGCKDKALADGKQGCCKDKAAKAECKDSGCKDKASAGCKDSGCKDKAAAGCKDNGCKDKAAAGCKTAETVKSEGCTTKKAA